MDRRNHSRGFTSAELLLVLAMGAVVIGAAVVSFGTLVRNQPRVSAAVEVDLGSARLLAYYGLNAAKKTVASAPNYGTAAEAEKLRELFHNDIVSATAVYCLARDTQNTFHPTSIDYDPAQDAVLDTSRKFREHIQIRAGVASSAFKDYRNYSEGSPNASVFILGFSRSANQLKVNAVYDIDVVKVSSPKGIYASVKRFTDAPQPQYYDIFYPPSDTSKTWTVYTNQGDSRNWSMDSFMPLFVSFERSALTALAEGTSIDRFKKAAERPFHFIWWPDPAMRDLVNQPNSFAATDPRKAYNHQGGRTSFMFVVPMFPAL